VVRRLRKGAASIEYWFGPRSESNTVRVVDTEVELKDDHAVFRTTLKPSGFGIGDADDVFVGDADSINKIDFNDDKVRELTDKFLNAYKDRLDYVKLEVKYKGSFVFDVGLKPTDDNGLSFEIKR